MSQVEDIKVLNIDGVTYAVDSMSEQVQQMVGIYNGWNQKESDARDQLMLVQAAKNDLSRQIIMQVRKDKEEADAAAAAAAAPAEAAPATTEAPAEEQKAE